MTTVPTPTRTVYTHAGTGEVDPDNWLPSGFQTADTPPRPLYYFVGDSAPGEECGNGLDGGNWGAYKGVAAPVSEDVGDTGMEPEPPPATPAAPESPAPEAPATPSVQYAVVSAYSPEVDGALSKTESVAYIGPFTERVKAEEHAAMGNAHERVEARVVRLVGPEQD